MMFLFDINPFSFSVEVIDSSEDGEGSNEDDSEFSSSERGFFGENYLKKIKRFFGFSTNNSED